MAKCAEKFGVDRRVLHAGIVKRGGIFPGKGNHTAVLSQAEENKICDHLVYMSEIGAGAS